jgi:GT2 family glycosyltransferase
MRLLIVIVNYRTAALTVDCLASLEPEVAELAAGGDVELEQPGGATSTVRLPAVQTRVVVTDGDSGDDSVPVLRQAVEQHGWGDWCELMPLEANRGFAAGNNAAIEPAMAGGDPPDHVLLLNPDTVTHPDAVRTLLAFQRTVVGCGIAGSRLEHRDATPQASAFQFLRPLTELGTALRLGVLDKAAPAAVVAPPVRDDPHRTDWVAGASMLVRREVFDDIGSLDDGYFMYFEEVDFCRRAAGAGHACWYVPQSRVVHLVGQSSGVTSADRGRRRRPAYWFEARSRYFRKHFGRGGKLAADVAWAGAYPLYRLKCLLQRRAHPDPPRLWSDFLRHNFWPGKVGG